MKHPRLVAVAVPATLYAASMFLPVFSISYSSTTYVFGYDAFDACLRLLWKVDVWDRDVIAYFSAWMANPALWCALICLACGFRFTAILSSAAACVSACVLLTSATAVLGYPGYWVWWASMLAALLSAVFLLKRSPVPFAADFGPLKAPDSRTPSPT